MIQVWLAKKIVGSIINAIQKKHDLKKIDDYVNKKNELDIKMEAVQKNVYKCLKNNEELEKEVAILNYEIEKLKIDSHPPQEYICCRKCGCKISKTKEK